MAPPKYDVPIKMELEDDDFPDADPSLQQTRQFQEEWNEFVANKKQKLLIENAAINVQAAGSGKTGNLRGSQPKSASKTLRDTCGNERPMIGGHLIPSLSTNVLTPVVMRTGQRLIYNGDE